MALCCNSSAHPLPDFFRGTTKRICHTGSKESHCNYFFGSSFVFLTFLPVTALCTRTFGNPIGLLPATQRSSSISCEIRSPRDRTLRERDRPSADFRVLSMDTTEYSNSRISIQRLTGAAFPLHISGNFTNYQHDCSTKSPASWKSVSTTESFHNHAFAPFFVGIVREAYFEVRARATHQLAEGVPFS